MRHILIFHPANQTGHPSITMLPQEVARYVCSGSFTGGIDSQHRLSRQPMPALSGERAIARHVCSATLCFSCLRHWSLLYQSVSFCQIHTCFLLISLRLSLLVSVSSSTAWV